MARRNRTRVDISAKIDIPPDARDAESDGAYPLKVYRYLRNETLAYVPLRASRSAKCYCKSENTPLNPPGGGRGRRQNGSN